MMSKMHQLATNRGIKEEFNTYCHFCDFLNFQSSAILCHSLRHIALFIGILFGKEEKLNFLPLCSSYHNSFFSTCQRVNVKIQFLVIALLTIHSEIREISCSHCLPRSSETQSYFKAKNSEV